MPFEPWRPLFECGARAYYEGDVAAGRQALERLLARPDLPPEIRQQARRNQIFYAAPLSDLVPGVVVQPIDFGVRRGGPASIPASPRLRTAID